MKIRVSSACFLHSGEKYLNRNIHLSHQRATFVSGPNVSKREFPSANYFQKSHGIHGKRSIAVKRKILFITSNILQIFLFQNFHFAIISALFKFPRYGTIPRIIFIIKTDEKKEKIFKEIRITKLDSFLLHKCKINFTFLKLEN